VPTEHLSDPAQAFGIARNHAAAPAAMTIGRWLHPVKSAFWQPRLNWIDVDTTGDSAPSGPQVIGFAVVYGTSGVDYKIVAALTDGLLVYCLASGQDAGMWSDTVPNWNSRTRFADAAGFRRRRTEMRHLRVWVSSANSHREIPDRCPTCNHLLPATALTTIP